MKCISLLRLLLTVATVCLFSGCGSSSPVVNPGTLSGNWLLVGSLPAVSPFPSSSPATSGLAITIDSNGSAISANATLVVPCVSGSLVGESVGGSYLTGTAASDGKFSLATATSVDNGLTVKVTGTVPAAVGMPWSGTYAVSAPSSVCAVNQTGTFEATALGAVTGTYTGTGTPGEGSSGTNPLALTLTVQQGAQLYKLNTTRVLSELALGGSLSVQGIPCFTHGSISTTEPSQVFGSGFSARYLMDDGSDLLLEGGLGTDSSAQLQVQQILVGGGSCAGSYEFVFEPLVLQRN